MKVLFIQYAPGFYLAPMLLSAMLKKDNHEVELIVESDEERILNKVKTYQPKIVAFSVTTGNHVWFGKIGKTIKQHFPNITTIAGGPHPTFFPEYINTEGLDIIARGEAEYALLELANNLENNQAITSIKNLYVKQNGEIHKNELRPLLENLDELPHPDRTIYKIEKIEKIGLLAGRGCPYNCSFCFNHSLRKMYKGKGKYLRMKGPKAFVQEIKHLKDSYGLKAVVFNDDIFTTNREWLKKFADIYKREVNLPFKCFIRANEVTEELIQLLKSANCESVYFGIESGDQELRHNVLNKHVTDKQIIKTARLLKKYKIRFGTFNMMGIPGETVSQALKTIKINRYIKTDFPRIMLLQPYPRTDICEYAVANGYMNQLNIDKFGVSFVKDSLMTQPNINRLINLQKLSYYGIQSKTAEKIIKQLIKLPPNPFFDMAFLASLAFINSNENKQSLFTTILKGLKVLKQAY